MTRLAMFCGDDGEQLMRVFKSSGQYREDKPNAYYEKMAKESMQFIENIKHDENKVAPVSNLSKGRFGLNAKT